MGHSFHQTNNNGSIGTQAQVGDNTLNVGLIPTIDDLWKELEEQTVGLEWSEETDSEVKDNFATPETMLVAARAADKVPAENQLKEDGWLTRFKALIPLGVKITSQAAIAALTQYSPTSIVLSAISKALLKELQSDESE